MTGPKITRDVTRDGGNVRYVYSFCSSCSYWHAFAWTIADAYAQGERHLINVHDIEPRIASTARRVAKHQQSTKQPNGSE